MADQDHYVVNEGTLRVPRDWRHVVQTVFITEDGATLVIQARTGAEDFETALLLAGNDLPEFKIHDRRPIAFQKGLGEMAEVTFRIEAGPQHQIVVRYTMGARSLTFHGTTVAPMPAATRQALLGMIASFQPFADDHA